MTGLDARRYKCEEGIHSFFQDSASFLKRTPPGGILRDLCMIQCRRMQSRLEDIVGLLTYKFQAKKVITISSEISSYPMPKA